MSRKLTLKQKKFADKYLETGNGALSVRESYAPTTDLTARSIASENLTKPNVIEYLESKQDIASHRIVELALQDEHLPTALSASKDILDRLGYGVVDKSINVNVNIDELKAVIVGDLNRFRQLKSPSQ